MILYSYKAGRPIVVGLALLGSSMTSSDLEQLAENHSMSNDRPKRVAGCQQPFCQS
jgi:hypothetical protein